MGAMYVAKYGFVQVPGEERTHVLWWFKKRIRSDFVDPVDCVQPGQDLGLKGPALKSTLRFATDGVEALHCSSNLEVFKGPIRLILGSWTSRALAHELNRLNTI